MIYEWLYATPYDWGDEESSLIIVAMSEDTQAILGHPFCLISVHGLAPWCCLSLSCDSCLAYIILLCVRASSTYGCFGESLTQSPFADVITSFEMLPVQSSNCSLRGRVTLVLNACPVTCKIGLKRLVCPRISDPRPRHAFPESGCAINIRTMESFINNTLVTDTMTDQTWKELGTVRNPVPLSVNCQGTCLL